MLYLLLNFLKCLRAQLCLKLGLEKYFSILFWTLKKFLWIWKYLQCIWVLFGFSSFKFHDCISCCLFSPRFTKEKCGFIRHKVPCPHNPLKLVTDYKLKSFNTSQQWICFNLLCVAFVSPSLFWGVVCGRSGVCAYFHGSSDTVAVGMSCDATFAACNKSSSVSGFRFGRPAAVLFRSISSFPCSLVLSLIYLKNKGGTRCMKTLWP